MGWVGRVGNAGHNASGVTFFGSSAVHGFSISAYETFANSLWDFFFLSHFKAVDGI